MKVKERFKSFAEDYSADFDSYGQLMIFYFDLAAHADIRGIQVKDYKAGACGSIVEDEFLDGELRKLSDNEIKRLLRFCSKLHYMIDKAGKSY